jgi:acyl-CoA reductase-like NAD-dependent aldehyde dehydrogenase
MSKPLPWDGKWEDVLQAIHEIEWYASRAKNLSEAVEDKDYDWAYLLQRDIEELMEAIDLARRPV